MKPLKELFHESMRRGIPLFAVGGWIRDQRLGRGGQVDDFDLVSEKNPVPLARFLHARFGGKLDLFEEFGTARVLLKDGTRVDLAQTREETYSAPAALPTVRVVASLESDLKRRDFTVNAIAAPLRERGFGELIDPFGGVEDLRRKRLRGLHPLTFRDDPTRLFRAARYGARLGFRLDDETEAWKGEALAAGWPKRLSRERLRTELVCILEEKHPAPALKQLKAWGLAALLHPKLSWPSSFESGRGAWERLGMLALAMGSPEGDELVESLHLERPIAMALFEALKLARERASPRGPLSPLTISVLQRSFRRLHPRSLSPLLVDGSDLKKLGVEPGPEFKRRLAEAAKAQWAGRISTRAQALAWLRKHG